ncbi:hypothetical protein AC1031_013831 [Aphanomyces cochlioides]|nr:hypothetical protein AC1031_013831 [Aphanomyces cochlioides]
MFDSGYFESWFRKLLDELRVLDVVNAIIVLDNAKYHKSKPPDTPAYKDKKKVLQEACDMYGIDYDCDETKPILWSKLKQFIDKEVKPQIVTMAEANGHQVLVTPPHHSDLHPIETIWAIVKGEVGRQYDDRTTFQDVKQRLIRALDNLQPSTIFGCIKKTEAHLLELQRYIRDEEEILSDSDDGSDDNDESENDLSEPGE